MDLKNKNTGIIITLIFAVLITMGITAYVYTSSLCNLDNKSVCYDKYTGYFLIEEEASLDVQVEHKDIGEALVARWNELHPDHNGSLTYTVAPTLTLQQLQEGINNDIVIANPNDAVYFMDKFKNLGQRASGILGESFPSLHQDSINARGFYFIPNTVSGQLFVYNKTLMESLGYSTDDIDNSGIPDTFETWELILENSKELFENPGIVFPLTFEDQNMFYPFLTGGRWTLNFTKNGSNPEFGSNEFLDSLQLIYDMGEVAWDKFTATPLEDATVEETLEESPITPSENAELGSENSEETVENPNESTTDPENEDLVPAVPVKYINTAESLKWQFETAFFEGKTLFTIATDIPLFDSYEASTQSEYIYAPFPTYKDHHLTQRVDVEGYFVSSDSMYPSAAAEVIRILRTPEMVVKGYNTTGKIPSYHRNHLEDLNLETKVKEKVLAYSYGDTLPISALNKNPQVLSRNLYYEVDIMPVLRKLFNHTMTPKEAQEEIVLLSKSWLDLNDIIEEE